MSLDFGFFTSIMERYNLSMNSVAHAIVILYAIGIVNLTTYKIMEFPLPLLAAIYALAIFVLDKVGSSVYPRLHPDTCCERCGSKQLRITSAVIKCQKCEYPHKIGK